MKLNAGWMEVVHCAAGGLGLIGGIRSGVDGALESIDTIRELVSDVGDLRIVGGRLKQGGVKAVSAVVPSWRASAEMLSGQHLGIYHLDCALGAHPLLHDSRLEEDYNPLEPVGNRTACQATRGDATLQLYSKKKNVPQGPPTRPAGKPRGRWAGRHFCNQASRPVPSTFPRSSALFPRRSPALPL